jgi:lipopolysaccharide assembly protein A
MLILILFLIVGSLLVYISKFNFMPVSVNLGMFVITDVPLFYVIIGSLLIGLILSYLVYLIHGISTSFILHGKNNEIKKNRNEVSELTKKLHQLESDNKKLEHEISLKSQLPTPHIAI